MDPIAVDPGACAVEAFVFPDLFGASFLSLQANLVENSNVFIPGAWRLSQPGIHVRNVTFCNVTVTYTHPGHGDSINVEAWLPIDNWNRRLQAVGGGGWVAGRLDLSYASMAGAVGDGYATVTTDAGLGSSSDDPDDWALLSPGNVNLHHLLDLGSVSLNDQAIIVKSLIMDLYGEEPAYSYWNGCSQGGRQGLMAAQRYPELYDGIFAGAPAVYWSEIEASMFWPQVYMLLTDQFPENCELDALGVFATAACDELDGVVDGIVGEVDECLTTFNPFDLVGTEVNCSGTMTKISTAAANVANATWWGPISSTGEQLWYGPGPGSDLTGSFSPLGLPSVATTDCSSGTCTGVVNNLTMWWYRNFVTKDPEFDYTKMTHEDFDAMFHSAKQEFDSFMETNDADLSAFRDAGGKLVTFHGTADPIIPVKGTQTYYEEVTSLLPDVHDFYRYFEVPGLDHCFGWNGGQPIAIFDQLRAWVENGTAPESSPVTYFGFNGTMQNRIICPYPQKAKFDPECADSNSAKCWSCSDTSRVKH